MSDAMYTASWQDIPSTDKIGNWFEDVVDWLGDNLEGVFDFVTNTVEKAVEQLTDGLQWLPPTIMIALLAALAYWLRGWQFGLATLVGFAVVDSMEEFDAAMQTLSLVLVAAAVAVLLSVPIGILAARNRAASQIVKPMLDLMQTMPPFVYLLPAVGFFGLGITPGVAATIVFAMPPGVRLTELGIRQVDPEMVEAGEAFGSSPMKVLTGIQIPLAMPSIMAGINQVIMLSLSMVVIGGMVGAPGLGEEVYGAVTSVDLPTGFESGLSVVIVAIFLDRISAAIGSRSAIARAQSKVSTAS